MKKSFITSGPGLIKVHSVCIRDNNVDWSTFDQCSRRNFRTKRASLRDGMV